MECSRGRNTGEGTDGIHKIAAFYTSPPKEQRYCNSFRGGVKLASAITDDRHQMVRCFFPSCAFPHREVVFLLPGFENEWLALHRIGSHRIVFTFLAQVA